MQVHNEPDVSALVFECKPIPVFALRAKYICPAGVGLVGRRVCAEESGAVKAPLKSHTPLPPTPNASRDAW